MATDKWGQALNSATRRSRPQPQPVRETRSYAPQPVPFYHGWRPIRSLILNALSIGGLIVMVVGFKATTWEIAFTGMFLIGVAYIGDMTTRRPDEGTPVGIWIVNALAIIGLIAVASSGGKSNDNHRRS